MLGRASSLFAFSPGRTARTHTQEIKTQREELVHIACLLLLDKLIIAFRLWENSAVFFKFFHKYATDYAGVELLDYAFRINSVI